MKLTFTYVGFKETRPGAEIPMDRLSAALSSRERYIGLKRYDGSIEFINLDKPLAVLAEKEPGDE